mgnify:CR=1 FL=1
MTPSSASRVEGAWKISDATSPLTCDSGNAGQTTEVVNTSVSVGIGATEDLVSMTMPASSKFSAVVTVTSWPDGYVGAPASYVYHVIGATSGAAITHHSENTVSGQPNSIATMNVTQSGLDLVIEATNITGGSYTFNSIASFEILAADSSQ